MLEAFANSALVLAQADIALYWPWAGLMLLGAMAGFFVVWVGTKDTRRDAHEQASALIEVAKREAQVAGEEIKQHAERELEGRRAEVNRELDRREIEMDLRLREIRSHEESLALLDHQLSQHGERLTRESSAIKQARDAIRAISKSS
jgi:ribonuclease Y